MSWKTALAKSTAIKVQVSIPKHIFYRAAAHKVKWEDFFKATIQALNEELLDNEEKIRQSVDKEAAGDL